MNSSYLPLQVKDQLTSLGKTICVAESLTAGNLCAAIASVSGSSNYLQGGLVAYNLRQKVTLLGVDEKHARAHNCVSPRVAREMAVGVRERFQADIAVATTGYAEPSPDDNVSTPFAFFAINIDGDTTAGKVVAANLTRVEMQEFVVTEVLQAVSERLEGMA